MINKICTVTSHSNTTAPLSKIRLCYSSGDLKTLNNLIVTDLNHIDAISIQELCQALEQSAKLAQCLLANANFTVTIMVVDFNHLRQQHD
jgi:hypothetical protein